MVVKQSLDGFTEGDDVSRTLTIKDSDGNAIDISNWVVWYTVKEDESDLNNLLQTRNGPGDHSDPQNGETLLKFSSNQTSGVVERDRDDLVYDIQIKNGNGDITTLFKGSQPIQKGVTDVT